MKNLIIKREALIEDNLKKIKMIDEIFYADTELTMDWYLKRYKAYHYGYLLFDDDLCVGYIVCVPIKKELFDLFINGAYDNDVNISHDMFIEDSCYKYISSAVILDKYRHLGLGSKLMKALLKDNKGNLCALTVSKDGYNLIGKYMKLVKQVNNEVNIFTLENND